jgi:AraC-like DNA-binding protein
MPSESTDFAPLRVSTDALPARDRLPFWREAFGRKFLNIVIEPLSDAPFGVEATLRALPGFRLMECAASPAQHQRTPEIVSHGDDAFTFPMNLSGGMTLSQRNREVSLDVGDAVSFLNAEPSTLKHSQVHALGLVVPRAALTPLVANVEDAAMRVIPHSNEALRLLTNYLKTVCKGPALAAPELRHLVATHVHDLVAMMLGATRDGTALAAGRGLRAARLAAIKADITAHLGHRDLTLTAVAARQQVTPRYVQMLFEGEGVTFSQFLLEQRLARVHRMLAEPRHAGSTISAIAFAAGFGDLSHFNRSFRRRYGAAPSEIRGEATRAETSD